MHDLDKAKCDTCQRKMMMKMMMENNESELMFGYINYKCRRKYLSECAIDLWEQ